MTPVQSYLSYAAAITTVGILLLCGIAHAEGNHSTAESAAGMASQQGADPGQDAQAYNYWSGQRGSISQLLDRFFGVEAGFWRESRPNGGNDNLSPDPTTDNTSTSCCSSDGRMFGMAW